MKTSTMVAVGVAGVLVYSAWQKRQRAVVAPPLLPGGNTVRVGYAGTLDVPYDVLVALTNEAVRRVIS